MNQKDNHDITKPEERDHRHEKTEKPVKEVTIALDELESLKSAAAERDQYYDKFLRAHADIENAKKRLEREKTDILKFAGSEFVYKLLPILDNLEIAMKHAKEAKDLKSVQEGMTMIQLDIRKFLTELGVEKVKALGEKFDPLRHEALEFVSGGGEEDTITEELQSGYTLNGKLICPAAVKIIRNESSPEGETEEPEEDSAESEAQSAEDTE
ncbi:MAG: nucleotide exchange factor GrpE [Candidatus Omnitrophota bacterium]